MAYEPRLLGEDADFKLVGGNSQLVGPAEHSLEVARVGGYGPADLVERKVGVSAEPARHEAVEDERWSSAGRGAEVQELDAEGRTEVRQSGTPWSPKQAYASICRPPATLLAAA